MTGSETARAPRLPGSHRSGATGWAAIRLTQREFAAAAIGIGARGVGL
jgi:hypothetical protein